MVEERKFRRKLKERLAVEGTVNPHKSSSNTSTTLFDFKTKADNYPIYPHYPRTDEFWLKIIRDEKLSLLILKSCYAEQIRNPREGVGSTTLPDQDPRSTAEDQIMSPLWAFLIKTNGEMGKQE